jgi:hypothetical protein
MAEKAEKLQDTIKHNFSEALEYARIYSIHGLEEMIKDNELLIQVKNSDLKKVEAGELWNPLMKNFNMKELSEDMEKLSNHIVIYTQAIKIKQFREQYRLGYPTTIEIDGMMLSIDK